MTKERYSGLVHKKLHIMTGSKWKEIPCSWIGQFNLITLSSFLDINLYIHWHLNQNPSRFNFCGN